jgi:hypothetical protein
MKALFLRKSVRFGCFKGVYIVNKMPPRARKAGPKNDPPLSDDPIVYFLKVSKDIQQREKEAPVPEAFETTDYAVILKEEEVSQQQFDETVIHAIIAKIHHQSEYPSSTACFWCCHPFAWKAVVLPTHYDVYINQYSAEGNFCSPECALSFCYSDHLLTDSQKWLRHSLLRSLYASLYPGDKDIIPAPDKRCLRMFGGTLSIEQYRRYIKEGSTTLQIAMPPIRLYMPSINTQSSARDIKTYVSLSNETVDKASQQLRLKRTKPVHSSTTTLDKCMGLGGS